MWRGYAFIALSLLNGPSAAVAADDTLTPKQAAARVGQNVTVQMKVKGIGFSGRGFTDLISEDKHQHADAFIITVSPAAKEQFKSLRIPDVARHFAQQFVRVTGKVKVLNYSSIGRRPVIEVTEASQLEIIDVESMH